MSYLSCYVCQCSLVAFSICIHFISIHLSYDRYDRPTNYKQSNNNCSYFHHFLNSISSYCGFQEGRPIDIDKISEGGESSEGFREYLNSQKAIKLEKFHLTKREL